MLRRRIIPALAGLVLLPLASAAGAAEGQTGVRAAVAPEADAPVVSNWNNKCIDVPGGRFVSGERLQMFTCNGTNAQTWTVKDRRVQTGGNLCMDAQWAGTANGTAIQVVTCKGNAAQEFVLNEAGDLVNPASGRCVDISAWNGNDGAALHLWDCVGGANQKWRRGSGALPGKVVAGYYPNWKPNAPRLRDINPNYNVLYLFAARPVGGSPGSTGDVVWEAPGNGRGAATNFKADLAFTRNWQGRTVILSVGGAGNGMSFPSRDKSTRFVESVASLYDSLGGFDGLDWNTFEADQRPDTAEMIWISLELKRRYPGFIITAPPAPWSQIDKDFCLAMVRAGALDYAAPQYYDGPNLADPAYAVDNVAQWVSLLGARRVVVGFGINNATNYMTSDQAVSTWNEVEARHPDLRGAFDWEITQDEALGWPFGDRVAPLVRA